VTTNLLDEPRLELLELNHVVDSVSNIPDLVGIDHEDASGGTGVLVLDCLGVDLLSSLGQVLGVVDDGSDDVSSSEIVLDVGSDLEL
jgi:hypothetical protein